MRMATATAVTPVSVLVIDNSEMFRVLHAENAFSDRFITYMLQRNIRIEEDLIDQLFNSSEKRLARTLLLLARYGKQDQSTTGASQNTSRNAGGNDRHHALSRQFFHE